MPNQFAGTGVALVTPFRNDNTIDFTALEKLTDHVIEGGVNYLVSLGTTGETPTLSAMEKKQVLACTISKCSGRVPVVCGIGGNNTHEVIAQLNEYDLDGVSGILSVVPYYSKPSQEGLYQHFRAIAKATEKPIILYNVPGRTSLNMTAATSLRLANEFPNIVAIKEASGNLAQCMELMEGKPDHFAILSGDDDLILPQMALGMEGVISVAANCFTRDFTDMVNAGLAGDFSRARVIHYELLPGIRLLFAEGNPAGVKAVLSKMGICENILRLPVVPVSEAVSGSLDSYLRRDKLVKA